MREFRRVGEAVEAELDEFEVALLTSLTEQLEQLLGGTDDDPDPAGMDAFAWLAASTSSRVELDHDDPLVERLFPPAYPGDAAASADFRRFTEDDARLERLRLAREVLEDLAATRAGVAPLNVGRPRVEAWLKTINALRLSLSVRLGITDEASLDALGRLSARDPRTQIIAIYDWLGYVLESLLEAL